MSISTQSATSANHAIGAIVLSLFGAVWLVAWCLNYLGRNVPILGFITVVATLLTYVSARKFRLNRRAYGEYSSTVAGRRQNMKLGLVNATQWLTIVASAFILSGLGLLSYFVPAVILIVGLHFIPLASLLNYRPYFFTAAALSGFAVAYSVSSRFGPESTVGLLGTGVILWATALGLIRSSAETSHRA